MAAQHRRKRRRFTGETISWTITQPKSERAWIDQLAKPRMVGAVEIVRDALAVYQAILKIIAPRKKNIPPITDIITLVRAALTDYLARQQRADTPSATQAADHAPPAQDAGDQDEEVAPTEITE